MRGPVLLALLVGYASAEYACPVREPANVAPADDAYATKPYVDGAFKFIGGKKSAWDGEVEDIKSPVVDAKTGKRAVIGQLPMMDEATALEAVQAAAAAWDRGQGVWPQMSLAERVAAVEKCLKEMEKNRDEIINVLLWEIAKNSGDAAKEFDRTMEFAREVMKAVLAFDSSTPFG